MAESFPHMCRDGHDRIGFSGDNEMCPVCKVQAEVERLTGDPPTPPFRLDAAILRRLEARLEDIEAGLASIFRGWP